MILLRNNFIVLLVFVVIGFLVHVQSLQMVLYGDDWRFIYNFFTHEEISSNFSPFPGLLSYLAPYGPSALTIGFLYQVFGSESYIYYLVPIIFKILTAFVIFLILRNISNELKRNDTVISEAFNNEVVISFLSATLFLVGTTGIQAIDWAFHINVYISMFIFALGLFFQVRFSNHGGKLNLLLGLFLSLSSIIVAPFRFLSVILIIPFIDLIFLLRNKQKQLFLVVLLKNIIFAIFAFIFFWIGLFGHNPQDLYSPFPIRDSIKVMIEQPLLSAKTFLHWIGVTIVPAYPAGSANSFIIGVIFGILLLVIFYKYRSKYIILGSVLYFIPLFLMWMITPLRNIDSGDKYLPLSFLGLCFLIGVLTLSTDKFKKLFTAVILGIVLLQAFTTIRIYAYWISIGRGVDFAIPAQEIIMSHFPTSITEPKIIYLDFEDPSFQQSIEFGIGYRIAVLSDTKGLNNLPTPMSNKENLMKLLKGKVKNEKMDQIVNNVYAFQFKNKIFTDVTDSFREEIKLRLNQ